VSKSYNGMEKNISHIFIRNNMRVGKTLELFLVSDAIHVKNCKEKSTIQSYNQDKYFISDDCRSLEIRERTSSHCTMANSSAIQPSPSFLL
jgi:hypothetical protein